MWLCKLATLVLLSCLSAVETYAHDSTGLRLKPYNEAVSDNGTPRPQYARFAKKTGIHIYPVNEEAVGHLLNMPLGDALKILPIALVLSDKDYKLLQDGARLRAETLVAFFADMIFNDGKKAINSGVITEKQFDSVMRTENRVYSLTRLREIWRGRSVKDINVIFGPDVVRNPHGDFRVLEDNIGGLIGGVGDMAGMHNAYFSSFGSNPNLQAPLVQALELFLEGIPKEKWSDDVICLYRKVDKKVGIKAYDEEDRRVGEVLAKFGIKIVEPSDLAKDDSQELKDILTGKYKKIVNFYSLFELDDVALMNKMIQGFKDGKFDLMVGPGIDGLGSKAMLPFIDQLSEVYFGKRAILLSQPTRWITEPSDVEKYKSGWVIKQVDGRQGKQVYIMDAMTDSGKSNLAKHLQEWKDHALFYENENPPRFIAQEMVDTSFIPADLNNSWVKFNVDYRPHVFIVNGKPTKPAIWGRASWKLPGVLNNVSQTAMELVVTSPSLCERELMSGGG